MTPVSRARANDVVLDDESVSAQHCRVRPEGGRFVVYDMGSTNGTRVNDRVVANHPLSEGDVIRIGGTSLEFRIDHGVWGGCSERERRRILRQRRLTAPR